jgi:hypothetical protein
MNVTPSLKGEHWSTWNQQMLAVILINNNHNVRGVLILLIKIKIKLRHVLKQVRHFCSSQEQMHFQIDLYQWKWDLFHGYILPTAPINYVYRSPTIIKFTVWGRPAGKRKGAAFTTHSTQGFVLIALACVKLYALFLLKTVWGKNQATLLSTPGETEAHRG